MTGFGITHAERAGWQRRAVAELARILDSHRDLPVLVWTVGAAGATLLGRVNSDRPAAWVRQVFDTWRRALALDEPDCIRGSGVVYLRATSDRNQVRLTLGATVDADQEVAW